MDAFRWFKLMLGALSCLFFVASTSGAQQARGMRVPWGTLPEELQALTVKDHFVPSDSREAGVLHALSGRVVVVRRAEGEAYFGKPGDKIYENDELNTLDDSRCRIRFYTDDVVNMGPETRFAVETFEDHSGKGEKRSFFSMLKGKAMFYALRLFRYRDTRFKVKTPTAVVGVRGTKFGMHVFQHDEVKNMADPILTADRGRSFDPVQRHDGGGTGSSGTIVACADGQLDVTDPTTGLEIAQLGPYEEFNTATGQKIFDLENRTLNQIAADTEVGYGGEKRKTGEEDGDRRGPDDTARSEILPYLPTDFSDVINQQNANETAEKFSRPHANYNFSYFSAMLTKTELMGTPIPPSLIDTYISKSPNDINENWIAEGLFFPGSGSNYVWKDDRFVRTNEGSPFVMELNIKTTSRAVGGLNFLRYGYWETAPQSFAGSGGDVFNLWNKAWWIEGEKTPIDHVANMNEAIQYSGVAHGTYWTASTGTLMQGTFGCAVNFGSGSVNHFDIQVSGGGHDATIEDAQGSLSGGDFSINPGTGAWKIDGMDATVKGAYGTICGPEGNEVGGVWGMQRNQDHAASGVFAGQR